MSRGKALVAIVVVVVAAVAASAFFLGSYLGFGRAPTEADEGPHYPGPMYVMKDRIVNMADQGGRRYLKISMSVEFSKHADSFRKASAEARQEKQAEFDKEIGPQVPLIEDALISLLASKSSGDVSTEEGKRQLKEEIRVRLNGLLGEGQVTNVYFTQFVMQ